MAEQFIQNPSVTPGDLQIELSGGYVTAISGHPVGGTGGGGGPSVVYTGVVGEITVDNQQGTIGIADEIKNSINSKASKVELNTTYNTLNEGKQDKLTFGYDDTAISSINGSAIAGQNDMSQYALKSDLDVVSGEVDILTDSSAKWNEVSAKFDTSSWNAYSGKFQLSGDYATKSDLDLYYKKTETSSKSEISAAIKDFITSSDVLQYNVTAVAGIEVTTATDAGVKTFGISVTSTPVVTDTRLSGFNGIQAYEDGNTSGLWDVGLTQNILNTINGKLDSSIAEQTYQPKGNYVSFTDITDMATKTWVGTQGYAKESDLQIVSGELENFALKSEIPTKVSDLADSANYYTTAQTSGANELSTEFAKYQTKGNYITSSDLVDSAKSATKAENLTDGTETSSFSQIKDSIDWGNAIAGHYQTHSGEFVTSSNASISAAGEQYALTTTGWAEVQTGTSFTGVTTDDTLTGAGTDGSDKLGVAWSALSSNKIDSAKSANSAEYITNGIGYSGFNDISAKFDSLTSYVPYSATVLPIGTNNTATNNSIAIGSNNTANDLGFAVGQSNTALKRSLAFGVNNYANDISLAIGFQNSASGKNDNNQSAVNIAIGYANSAADHAAALINVCTAENYAFAAGHANSAIDNSVAFGRNTSAYFYSFDFGHTNVVRYYSYAFGRGLHYEGQWADGPQYGAFVIGGWNATTSYATTADAPLFIIGNGTNNNPSDGFVVYRDGTASAKQFQNADGTDTINGTTYSFTGVDNIEILPNAATGNTANFPNDNVLRFILES